MAVGQSTIQGAVEPGSIVLPEEVRALAEGKDVTPGQEHDALYYFMTARGPGDHWVDVEMDFEGAGRFPLRFWLRPQRGKVIQDVENRHKKGDGPFAEIDQLEADAELVTTALLKVTDPGSGREIDTKSEAFTQGVASPVLALQARFEGQEGLLSHIANRVRSISGWASDRVGEAHRVMMTNAVGKR